MQIEQSEVRARIAAKVEDCRQSLAAILIMASHLMEENGFGSAADWRVTLAVRHPASGLFLSVTTDDPAAVAQAIETHELTPLEPQSC